MRIPKKGLLDRQKLTKAFHAKLRAGTYLVSNCGAGTAEEFEKREALGLPAEIPDKQQFEEYVVTGEHREEQWNRIVERKANGRMCWVFESESEWKAFRSTIGGSPGDN